MAAPQTWGELSSIASLVVVALTFVLGRVSASRIGAADKQRTQDKLDRIADDLVELKDGVRQIDRKLDDHGERLTVLEQQVRTLFNRVNRIEGNCDAHAHLGGTD